MNKLLTKIYVGAVAMALAVPNAKAQTTFNPSSGNVYRIPSIVRLLPTGNLWAISDLRIGGNGDIGNSNRVDIAGRLGTLKEDNTYNWGNETVLLAGDANATEDFKYAYGDAASVVDRESGKVLLMTCAGKEGVNSSNAGFPLVARSVFDNNTWSTTNVTNQLYGTNNLFGVHLFVSSGRIIQSTIYKKKDYYRIYAGVCSVKSATVASRGSRVIYSDDFGVTWNYLGGYDAMPVDIGNECKIEELPDGSILLNTRTNAAPWFGRHMNIFKFTDIANGKGSWQSQYVTSGASNISGQTYAPDCNAELLLVPAKRTSDNVQTYLLLLSAPTVMPGRKNVSIYWKELPTEYTNLSNYVNGWTKYLVDGGKYCGYSTMVLDKNGNIAFLTENTAWMGPITFKSLSLKDITGNAYSYSPSTPGTYHTTSEPTWEHGVGGIVKPTMSVAGGTYANSQTITLTAPDGAQIYYTLDGSEPQVSTTTTGSGVAPLRAGTTTTGTQRYTDPITLSEGTTTLKALAVDNNGNKSQTVTSTYTILGSKSKTGTTVTLDHKSSRALYTNAGQNHSEFAYLRHNSTHIQLLSSTYAKLKKGEQVFKYTANNMQWTAGDSMLVLKNGRDTTTWSFVTQYSHYAILAPKGYRFLRYEIVLTSGSQEGGKLEEYTYKDGSDSEINTLGGTASATASATHDVTLSRTLEKATNVLYFRQDKISPGKNKGTTEKLHVKSIKLIYAIDNAFDETIPNNNGTGFHSGFIDFGTLSQPTTDRNYGFINNNPTDLEYFNVKDPNGSTPNTVSVDNSNYFVASTVGNYYVEAPTKFRIVGATIKLKRASSGTFGIFTPNNTTQGAQIVLGASTYSNNSNNTATKGNYLKVDDSGNISNVKNLSEATVFTVDYHGDDDGGNGENRYSLKLPNGKYLGMNANQNIVTFEDYKLALWSYNNGWKFPYTSGQYTFIGAWQDPYQWRAIAMQQRAAIAYTKPFTAANFWATVANPDGQVSETSTFKSDASNSEASYNVDNLNNDAIKINFTHIDNGEAALFNVQLKVIPLNPEVETIEAAAIPSDKSAAEGNSPVTSENYIFNHGNVINVPVTVGTKTATMVFRNANNEEKTLWYTNGGTNTNGASETGSYSNLYLIGGKADQAEKGWSTTGASPGARTDVDQIGTKQIPATNMSKLAEETQKAIKNQSTQPMTLQDNTVDAKTANYQTVTLTVGDTSDPAKYYLYSADRPTNNIMPEDIRLGRHIDFRFYTIRVKPVEAEVPEIEIVPLYTSTLKGRQNKTGIPSDGTELNTSDKYVGIKVTSRLNDGVTQGSVAGYLTAEAIEAAMKTALNNSVYKSPHVDDPLRNVLYVDMSSLTTVTTANSTTMADYANATADNCLFFMPIGFSATNMANTIAKRSDDSYQAIGDVTLKDQQPFFTPYDFTTGQFKAVYVREGTSNGTTAKAKVKNMTSVLPFNLTLDKSGHPFNNGEPTATSYMTFFDITAFGKTVTGVRKDETKHELTYSFVADTVRTLTAVANKPYYVKIDETGPAGFEFRIPGASFAKTPTKTDRKTPDPDQLTKTNAKGDWTANGTYNGVAPTKSEYLWYFAQDLFWKSSQLKYDNFYIRPFRAYFFTKQTTPSDAAKAGVVYDPSEITPTGISEVQTVHVNNGRVYTIDGRYVGMSLDNLAPGLYIQNGRKVVKQ